MPSVTRALALLVLVAPRVAGAAPCGAPDFLTSLPRDGATGVPINAVVTAHYASPATYGGESVTVEHESPDANADTPREPPRDFTGVFDANEGLLSVTFDEPLVGGDEYTVTWPRLHASDHAAKGKGGKVAFRVGSESDTQFPSFGGVSGVTWDVVRERDDCTNSLEDRFAFDLTLLSASDDGGRGSLELVVFQSRAPGVQGDEVLHVPIPAKGDPVRVERALDDASGQVCFSAVVRDLLGLPSAGDSRAVCTTTVPPPFFYGCRVARATPTRLEAGPLTVLLLLSVALVARRRREAS